MDANQHSFNIRSNTETNLKREGKWHTKAITLRSGVVVKDPIRLVSGEEEGEKEDSTYTPSVVDRVQEEVESKPAKS
ncbi:hypothetical protein PVK06_047818 [Gossypium arboreum]|uniref:Uncharacterized protein n=1 Tax=Gossypium arboreum TaxID=29729 RepID=A0ABR0MEB9_GOSAR|nr:hypothetical protein PVK06_047818 [Gossypium arboreum]